VPAASAFLFVVIDGFEIVIDHIITRLAWKSRLL
jgi:hypothetical protein